MIRVLVVDPSVRGRRQLAGILDAGPGIEVVDVASEASVAFGRLARGRPDAAVIDLQMGTADDLALLRRIMAECPTPVVMVGEGGAGCADALAALDAGAVDVVRRPRPLDGGFASLLRERVLAAARVKVRSRGTSSLPRERVPEAPRVELVALGMSTGGAAALGRILPLFPADSPPIVIVDHMPAGFTREMALRLDQICGVRVAEATHDEPLQTGQARIAPGGDRHLRVVRDREGRLRTALVASRGHEAHVPSVDALFASVADAVGPRAAAALMTGMGRDGAQGLLAIRHAGGLTIGQDEATCVVYGMPRAARELGAVREEVGLLRIPLRLVGPRLHTSDVP